MDARELPCGLPGRDPDPAHPRPRLVARGPRGEAPTAGDRAAGGARPVTAARRPPATAPRPATIRREPLPPAHATRGPTVEPNPVTDPASDPNAVAPSVRELETIVSLSKRRGFIFPSSEIYGGINAVWDYGPLGVELKNNVKRAWWRSMVQSRDDIVGLDSGILMHPQIWVTSGHVAEFNDPMVECAACKRRFRVDEFAGAEDLGPKELLDPGIVARLGLVCPQRRRPARRAAPLQPHAQDVPRSGRGRGCGRLPAPRDGPGHLRELPERARHRPQEDPLRDRPGGQGVPERDQPRQLRLPDARVRADGDAVLRPPGHRVGALRGRGFPAARPGTRPTALRRSASASASTGPTSWPTTPRRPSTSSTASPSAGRSSRGSTTGETGISAGTRRSPARTSSTSTRPPRSTTSPGSSRRRPGATGPRSPSSSTPTGKRRSAARSGSSWGCTRTSPRTRWRSCRS